MAVKDRHLSISPTQPPPPLRACSTLPLSSMGHRQPRAWHPEELVGPQPWLVTPWCWCYSAGGEIVCEKSLEGDAGPRLPCRVAEGEQSHTRRYGASYLLVIEPITWLCFSVAPWTQDSCSLGSTKLDLYEQQAQKTPAALPELVILQIRTQSKPCSCRVTRAGHTGRSRQV